mmetsp:Transcript_28806/g.48591  ORF Transcript_28806/g.48591 Transcript_28806/m.48591 type:complete len:1280 (-) Transcript_28806:339-4178(-)
MSTENTSQNRSAVRFAHEQDDNPDGFHNIKRVWEKYEEPEHWFMKRYRALSAKIAKKCESSHPEGYYHDPDLHDGLAMYYLDFTSYARSLVENENFNYFIIFVIFVAGINVGIQTYPQYENNAVLNIIDNIILLVFSFEVVVKMLAEGLAPYLYFFGKEWKWNNFDFTIVFLSLPFWGGLFGGGSLALLRLVRLMRLAKLIKKIPALQMIVRGLTGGLSSIAYILLLLILVFYLFAVTGFYLFSKNDPFHFKSLPVAMITMFRCATLDAWSDVMYLNIFGCDSYPYLYAVDEADFEDGNSLYWCREPQAQYIVSALYFVFFIVMSSLVMLSLFIGAVTLSMNDSLVELKTLAEERKKKERYDKNVTKMFLATSRVEKRKAKKEKRMSGGGNSMRTKLLSTFKTITSSNNEELEKFKTELQLAPGLVNLHRQQQNEEGGGPKTRSAILNHKKGAVKVIAKSRTPPPSRASTPNTTNPVPPPLAGLTTVKEGVLSINDDILEEERKYSSKDKVRRQESIGDESLLHHCYSSDDSLDSPNVESPSVDSPGTSAPDSPDSHAKKVIAKSLSMEDRIAYEHQAQIAAKEIEAIDKRKKVLSMIAEKNEGLVTKPRNFSFMVPDSIKSRFDRSLSEKTEQQATELGRLLRVAMGEQAHGEEEDPKSMQSLMHRMNKAKTLGARYKIFTEYCKFVAEHPWFVGMVTCVIVLAGINVGAQTESRLTGIEYINRTLIVLDIFILTVFTIEVVLKILAEGDTPLRYFHDGWNRFDFIIVAGSYVPGAGSLLTILRLLRLLRVLKLVKSLPQLAVIVNALIMGLSSIGYIGLILFLSFYIFAIAGMMMFRNNDPFHFGNLHISMFTLFRCSTLDDWSEVLYVNMYGCDEYAGVYEDFPEMCDSPKKQGILACIYFCSFIVIGAQVLLTLFIGVVTTSMEQAKEIQLKEQNMDRQLNSLEKSLGLSEIQMNCFRKAFHLLDLDGGGTIEEDEVALGLQSINNLMGGTSIEEEVKKSDPLGVGIDLLQFIVVIANIPRCKHRRLIKRTLKRWRSNKISTGKFYLNGAMRQNVSNAVIERKIQNQKYLDERPIVHSHYAPSRVQKEKLHALMFSYFQHHKLAFQFFQENEYSTQLDHLAFMHTKLERRHSCSNLPESQYEQYLCFGKEFNISDTQLCLTHSNTLHKTINEPAANSLRMLNKQRRQTHALSFGGSSKNFFKNLKKTASGLSDDALNSIRKSPESSSRTLGGSSAIYSPESAKSDESGQARRPSKLLSAFSFNRKISPRTLDSDL